MGVRLTQVQEERGAMLAAAQEHGFVADYSGWRRSLKGTRFKLIDVLLWNVISPGSEDIIGQVPYEPLVFVGFGRAIRAPYC